MSVNKQKGRTAVRAAVLLGGAVIYALLYALGSQIDERDFTQLGTTLLRFFAALPVALGVLYGLFRFVLPRLEHAPDAQGKKPFCTLGAFALIFVSFVPMFVIQYPGSFQYDTMTQVAQVASGQYSTFHPLLHTLLLRFALSFYDVFESFEKCGVVYSITQMLLVSGCFALICASLSRSVSRRAAHMTMAFFVLYPVHMTFACSSTKDVLFGTFCALYVALCLEEMRCGKLSATHRAEQVVSGVLACLLRNNMIYAVLVWLCVLAIFRRPFRRMLLFGVMIVVTSRVCNAGLVAATNADGGSIVEMLSVPIQQLTRARIHHPEAFTPEEAALMDKGFWGENYAGDPETRYRRYDPTLSDPIKSRIDVQSMRENMGALAKLWIRIGIKCPGEYVDAFVSLALPSLYPYKNYKVTHLYLETGNDKALTAPFAAEPIQRPRRFAAIRQWLDEHLFADGANDIPVIRYLFNLGVLYWTLLLFMLYDVYAGRWERVGVLTLVLLLYATFLLGPIMQARYAYPFMCMLPLFVLRPQNHLTGGHTDDV